MDRVLESEGTLDVTTQPLTPPERWRAFRSVWTGRVREHLTFDSGIGVLSAWAAVAVAAIFWLMRQHGRALKFLTAAHRSNRSERVRNLVEHVLARGDDVPASRLARDVASAYRQYLLGVTAGAGHLHPQNLIGSRILVLKSSEGSERGVIIVDYTYVFPLLARFFDLEALSRKYYIVLEPSWVGYCAPEILPFASLGMPVFVQTVETEDAAFLARISKHFVHVPIGGNWWVDHRMICPIAGVTKDVDLSMVAGWGRFKRHAAVFAALGRLRRRGHKLKVLLIGYPVDGTLSRDEVYLQARYFGVADQLEILQNLEPVEVSRQINRSKVHILWSRREGFNRAIIEAMLADVPGILREGHNYGQLYPYINPSTGRFAREETLPDTIVDMVEGYRGFSPRSWILGHMTPQIATSILGDAIRQVALQRGDSWTSDLAVKTVQLQRMSYWNPEDASRFAADYEYLRTIIRV
jgi:glycosyltransferase involved in cell wall biosynthesis